MKTAFEKGPRTGAFARFSWLVFAVLTGLLAACKEPQTPVLPLSPVISGGIGWVTIDSAYARLKTEPAHISSDSGYARMGDVMEIKARKNSWQGQDRGVWYRIEYGDQSGWLHESALTIYPNEQMARKAAGLPD